MISLIGKWIYTEKEDTKLSQECYVGELEDGDWLLVDVELTDDDAAFLKEYVVVPCAAQKTQDGEEPLLFNAVRKSIHKSNVEKRQKYFHGKMVCRMFPRKTVQPYKVEHSLKYKEDDLTSWDDGRFQRSNHWIETMSFKIPRPLNSPEKILPARVNVKRWEFLYYRKVLKVKTLVIFRVSSLFAVLFYGCSG